MTRAVPWRSTGGGAGGGNGALLLGPEFHPHSAKDQGRDAHSDGDQHWLSHDEPSCLLVCHVSRSAMSPTIATVSLQPMCLEAVTWRAPYLFATLVIEWRWRV